MPGDVHRRASVFSAVMGAAAYIVLEREIPGFDPFVNGKALAREADDLGGVLARCGVPDLFSFVVVELDDFDDVDDPDESFDVESSPTSAGTWFAPDEGLNWIRQVNAAVRAEPASLRDSSAVLQDLTEFEAVLTRAASESVRWRLAIDF